MNRIQNFQIAAQVGMMAGTGTADSALSLAETSPGPLCCHTLADHLVVNRIGHMSSSGCIAAFETDHPCSSIPSSRIHYCHTMAGNLDFRTCIAFGSHQGLPGSYSC